jgi:ankyrin repeat protein
VAFTHPLRLCYLCCTPQAGRTPAFWATFLDRVEHLSLQLRHGVDNNNRHSQVDSLIHAAAVLDSSIRCMELLLQHGAKVDALQLRCRACTDTWMGSRTPCSSRSSN